MKRIKVYLAMAVVMLFDAFSMLKTSKKWRMWLVKIRVKSIWIWICLTWKGRCISIAPVGPLPSMITLILPSTILFLQLVSQDRNHYCSSWKGKKRKGHQLENGDREGRKRGKKEKINSNLDLNTKENAEKEI